MSGHEDMKRILENEIEELNIQLRNVRTEFHNLNAEDAKLRKIKEQQRKLQVPQHSRSKILSGVL